MNKSYTISACLIVKDEEKHIFDCLNSIIDVVEEIILVDTGSSDKTIEIANGFTKVKLFNYDWDNNFSNARNFSLEQAQSDYILFIDADERLVNGEIIKDVLAVSSDNTAGWLLELTSIAEREDGITDRFVSNLLRLFKNDNRFRFKGVIHEQILESILENGYKLESTNIKINHIGYNLSKQEMLNKQLRNLKLLEIAIQNDPKNAYNHYQLAKTEMALGNQEKAEYSIEKAIEYALPKGTVKPQVLNFGAVNALQLKDLVKAKQRAEESLKINPNQVFANYIMAEVLNEVQDFSNSFTFYQFALNAYNSDSTLAKIVGDYHIAQEVIYFKLGRALIGLKKYEEAKLYFNLGLKINPNDASCLIGLANVAFSDKDFKLALTILQKAKSINPTSSDIGNYIKLVEQNITNESGSLENNKNNNTDLLTLCMIVKNEEQTLRDCLKSVRGMVDEIVIIDTGSTDNTLAIAKEFNAKIGYFDWINDFSAARNESLKLATCKWILYLDADERIKPIDVSKFRNHLANLPESVGGLVLTIESAHKSLTGETDTHKGGYPRIFRNLGFPRIKFLGKVHEQISPALREANLELINTDIVIHHLGYDQSREVMEAKVKRNYQLLLEHVRDEPLNGYAWFQLGQTLGQMDLIQQSEDAIKFAIQCGNLSDSVYASSANTLSLYSGKKGDFNTALSWAEKSLSKASEQVYARTLKAFALLNLKRFKEAKEEFEYLLNNEIDYVSSPKVGYDIALNRDSILKGLEEANKALAVN
jgi:glycosyltransferase involved in cell wall biosynthesis